MKKTIVGISLLISSVILFSIVHLSAVIYASSNKLGGWKTPPGMIGTALIKTDGVFPLNLSIIMGCIGVILITIEPIKIVVNKTNNK